MSLEDWDRRDEDEGTDDEDPEDEGYPCHVCGVHMVDEFGPDLDWYTEGRPPGGAACMEYGCGLYLRPQDDGEGPLDPVYWDAEAEDWLPCDPASAPPEYRAPVWRMSLEEFNRFRQQHPPT